MLGPERPKQLAAGGELTDEVGQAAIVGTAPGLRAQDGDGVAGDTVPSRRRTSARGIQEDEASPTGPLAPLTIERREVGPSDVLIDIMFCGICHSDIHHARGEWGERHLPGRARPRDRRRRRRGRYRRDAVAIGRPRRRRLHGELVPRVRELPPRRGAVLPERATRGPTAAVDRDGTVTSAATRTHVVVDEDFVLRIPDGLELDAAAPLLCAGITTYSPLRHWGAGPGKKVAVVGLGGLGHMAVKLAHAMGARGHRAVAVAAQAATTACASAPTRYHATSDADFNAARGPLRPHHQHGQRAASTQRATSACWPPTAPW